jgi:hypothetical protein
MFEDQILNKLNLEKSSIEDPRAWARKYFIAASVSWLLFELRMIGIKLNRLSSMEIQIHIQFELDIAINVLSTIISEAVNNIGVNIIRVKRSRTSIIES